MKSKLTKLALTATLGLAMAFTFSCSSDDGDKGGDGDKKKRNIAGCLRKDGVCQQPDDDWNSYTDEQLNTATKETCDKYDNEYLPGGCPTDWKAKCVIVGIVQYIYDDKKAENMLNSSTSNCTKK